MLFVLDLLLFLSKILYNRFLYNTIKRHIMIICINCSPFVKFRIFEPDIKEIADMVHAVGALLYMDGANFNALIGLAKPADFGVDIMHLNLHKTFAAPHGGGGPGSGPVGAATHVAPFLPHPIVSCIDGKYTLADNRPQSRNRMKAFYGNIKTCDEFIRFVMLTGVSKFSKISLFSDLNNLTDISLDERYADICGLTAEEIERHFSEHLEAFAQKEGTDKAAIMEEMRKMPGTHQGKRSCR